jgi:hypothetical protein
MSAHLPFPLPAYYPFTCPHDPEIWEGAPIRRYDDGSRSVGHSIVVDPKGTRQIDGAMCGLIAIFDADPRWIHNTTGARSPWGLFEYLTDLGWTFKTGGMLDKTCISDICEILECSILVRYRTLDQKCGKVGHQLTVRVHESHFLNGDEL